LTNPQRYAIIKVQKEKEIITMTYEVTYKQNGYIVTERCGAEWLKGLMNDPTITNLQWKAEI
jgi:hypothetical protein